MLRDPDGEPAGFLEITEDISERKRGDEELARLREELAQAQKMEAIGSLASGLAHDFNNFLGVILGCGSLMRLRLPPGDPLQEFLQMIEQSAESAADLARQLLALAQPELHLRLPVTVAEVLERVVKIVKRTFDRRIRVETRFAPELPAVEADVAQIEHAILNLCLNARDAMPGGGTLTLESSLVTLRTEDSLRPAQCQPGDYVRVMVKDTGLGIDPMVMPRLFQPFFTTKEPGRGSGLGLAIVHQTVRNHGGFVRVESEVVHGSEFQVYLPAVQQPARPLTAKSPAQVQYGSGTVLVVDDEPLVLAFVERGLQKLGYNVIAVDNGRRACEIYASRTQEIEYVLLDLVMPEVSGLETYQKLREINPQVRVILSSGYSLEKFAQEARNGR
jgi:signal transduction histidine kinase/CheY-like chemotaxis protein